MSFSEWLLNACHSELGGLSESCKEHCQPQPLPLPPRSDPKTAQNLFLAAVSVSGPTLNLESNITSPSNTTIRHTLLAIDCRFYCGNYL